jgi:glucosyl-3-phosphoglycerate synthase
MDMTVWEWFEQRSFNHRDFRGLASPRRAGGRLTTTLILPAREVAGTIGPILDTVARLNERSSLVDQVIVIDADSADGTAEIASARGAEVYSENELRVRARSGQGRRHVARPVRGARRHRHVR